MFNMAYFIFNLRRIATMRLLDQITLEVQRRRTFAIISHPDAGKTTLTEKLLLFSGENSRELNDK